MTEACFNKTHRQQCAPPSIISSKFRHVLPPSRTGKCLASLEEFYLATNHKTSIVKEYAIVVVTEQEQNHAANIHFQQDKGKVEEEQQRHWRKGRMLQGRKHRGFGKNMYTTFGGKKEKSETIAECASRELEEETGIFVPISIVSNCHVGTMHYTFQDEAHEMIAHVFHVDVVAVTESQSCPPSSHTKESTMTTTNDTTNVGTTSNNENDRDYDYQPYPIDPRCIRPCDEITPHWIDDWFDIPLDNMFADDSLWLTQLLLAFSEERQQRLYIDGWFHFWAGGQAVNSIQHYYMDIRSKSMTTSYNDCHPVASTTVDNVTNGNDTTIPPTTTFSLEKRLFHALHAKKIHSPSIKEFKEGWAFCNAVKAVFLSTHPRQQLDVILDVAGGHGALAALLLITTSATRAVVIDPAKVGNNGVERAWRKPFLESKQLDYRHEDLRTGLPAELTRVLQTNNLVASPDRVLVVACHACQHLSEEVLQIVCCRFPGVHVAVMPCCQKDSAPGSSWKYTSKNLKIPFATAMDILLAGKVMSWPIRGGKQPYRADTDTGVMYDYDVRMKMIDSKITPQNRVILCKAIRKQSGDNNLATTTNNKNDVIEASHRKLASVYARAHTNANSSQPSNVKDDDRNTNPAIPWNYEWNGFRRSALWLLVGFAAGFVVANMTTSTTNSRQRFD